LVTVVKKTAFEKNISEDPSIVVFVFFPKIFWIGWETCCQYYCKRAVLHQRVKCLHHFQEEEEGTRFSVKKMMNNIVEATILNGNFKGEDVLLPRIPTIPTDMYFDFRAQTFAISCVFFGLFFNANSTNIFKY
jgi:hypothetical protein